MKLCNLDNIFERRVLRIPDYQRGYAWGTHQINHFWEDIIRLHVDKIHYTGVVTLEPVLSSIWDMWEQDKWIIEKMEYRPFYIVDGQQRVTTSMILIQAIIEKISSVNNKLPEDQKVQLNGQSIRQIRNKYILHKTEDWLPGSFLFGYEKDSPSNEFLKTRIFDVGSLTNSYQETLYTRNLLGAKKFFLNKLNGMKVEEIALLFEKLTQKLKFNLYEIDNEIDVFVTFETMNNRGKPLTSLELLKNRLIYLSTLFEDHTGGKVLRDNINNAWKTIYEYLGKNADNPLDDNDFLRNHWIMYFEYSRKKGNDYINFLLDKKFTAQNVTHPEEEEEEEEEEEDGRLTVKEIYDYVQNLGDSSRPWFYLHNPYYAELPEYADEKNKMLLDRLNRLSFRSFKPLLLASYVSKQKVEDRNSLLEAVERYNFTLFTLSQRRANTGDSTFYGYARDLLKGKGKISTIREVIDKIKEWIKEYYDPKAFFNEIADKYKIGDKCGFYAWEGLRYFLYENEQWLQDKSKQSTKKLSWGALTQHNEDHVTVEHIFPQNASDPCWIKHFNQYCDQKKIYLTHSLGNLLPLSRAKNSSLQNKSFRIKKDNGCGVGYYNGSLSENEVSKQTDWDSSNILKRGLDLLEFMEIRWDIVLGDKEFKRKLLHLTFLPDDDAQQQQKID